MSVDITILICSDDDCCDVVDGDDVDARDDDDNVAVSYTHLTLPTIYSV